MYKRELIKFLSWRLELSVMHLFLLLIFIKINFLRLIYICTIILKLVEILFWGNFIPYYKPYLRIDTHDTSGKNFQKRQESRELLYNNSRCLWNAKTPWCFHFGWWTKLPEVWVECGSLDVYCSKFPWASCWWIEWKKRQTFGVSEIFLLYLLAHRSTSGLSSLKDAPSLGNSGLGSLKGVPPLPGMNNNNNSRGRSTTLHSFSWACCVGS